MTFRMNLKNYSSKHHFSPMFCKSVMFFYSLFQIPLFSLLFVPPLFCLSFMLRYSFAQCVGDSLLQVWSLGGSLETTSSKLVEAISFSPYFC
jgi:hypothetical protein